MTKKNLLSAAAAVALLASAGAASAHELTFRTDVAGGTIDSSDLGLASAYLLALESNAPADENDFLLLDTLSAGSSLPSGNVLVTVSIEGSTWDVADFTGGDIRGGAGCTSFTASISDVTATTAIFVVSNSTAGCDSFELDVPVNSPTGDGPVIIRTDIRTDGPGTPIDNPQGELTIIEQVQAFTPVINATLGAGAQQDTRATLTVLPVYTTFLTGGVFHDGTPETDTFGQLGTVFIDVNTDAHRNLSTPLIFADPADVVDADLVVTGDFTAFDDAGGAVNLGVVAAVIDGNEATIEDQQVELTTAPQAFTVQRETAETEIPSSDYSASLTYVLDDNFYEALEPNPFVRALERIERDGTNVVLPWMNSSTVQAANGSTNIVRLGNVSGVDTGPVFARVLNSTTGVSGPSVQLFENIEAGSERIINTALLTSELGEFGRGDIQISIEAPATAITARRFATLANGSVTELSNGTVASEQTPADPDDVQ